MCCEKDSYHRRWTLIVSKEYTTEMCFLDEWAWYITSSYTFGLISLVIVKDIHYSIDVAGKNKLEILPSNMIRI